MLLCRRNVYTWLKCFNLEALLYISPTSSHSRSFFKPKRDNVITNDFYIVSHFSSFYLVTLLHILWLTNESVVFIFNLPSLEQMGIVIREYLHLPCFFLCVGGSVWTRCIADWSYITIDLDFIKRDINKSKENSVMTINGRCDKNVCYINHHACKTLHVSHRTWLNQLARACAYRLSQRRKWWLLKQNWRLISTSFVSM